MNISFSQLRAMENDLNARVSRRVATFIGVHCDFSRPHDGSPALDEFERERAVRQLVDCALGYGIRTQRGITQFAMLGLGYSRTFHENAEVRRMLAQPDRSPDESIQAILDAVALAETRVRK